MNHDYAHCEDYDVNCPKECFRARLTEDLRRNTEVLKYALYSWAHFKETSECKRKETEDDANETV